MPDEIWNLLRLAAHRAGIKRSSWIRSRLLQAAAAEAIYKDVPVASGNSASEEAAAV